jgi:hypothetical protein
MNISQAVATAAAADDAKLRRAYAAAVARGANNTLCTAEQEGAYGTLRLLTLASLRLPDLFLYSHLLEGFADDPEVERVPPVVVGAVRGIAAGALRLAHRALETHGRDVGYETRAWIDRAPEQAGVELARNTGEIEEPEVSVVLDQSRLAAICLARATASTAVDRMRVPEEIARGLSHSRRLPDCDDDRMTTRASSGRDHREMRGRHDRCLRWRAAGVER